jgi:hypothetical protein
LPASTSGPRPDAADSAGAQLALLMDGTTEAAAQMLA